MIKTPDLRLASFLLARGLELTNIEWNGEGRAYFLIDAHEGLEHEFWGPKDQISAKRLFESWRYLRRLIDVGVRR